MITTRFPASALGGMLLVVLSVSVAMAQVLPISADESCPTPKCQVTLRVRMPLVGADLTPGGPPTSVVVDSGGRLWVAYPNELIRIFDRKGKFMSEVGRIGGGPNEFRGPYGLALVGGDSVLAFDSGTDRAMVISPKIQVARAIRGVGFLLPVIALHWPDSVLGSGQILTPSDAGWPLHLLSYEGTDSRTLRSFGFDRGALKPNALTDQLQRIATGPDRSVWSVDFLRLRVANWSRDGVLRRTFEFRPDWFPSASKDWIGNPATPPPPKVVGIAVENSGLLFIYCQVAADGWKSAWPRMGDGVRELSTAQIRFDKLYWTRVLVVDSKTGKLVNSTLLKEDVIFVTTDGRPVLFAADADDAPKLVLGTVQFRRM